MSDQDDVAASPQASGSRCARCGHVTGGCSLCGRNDSLLGSSIGGNEYCHTFSVTYPTCYMLQQWDASRDRLSLNPLTAPVIEAIRQREERLRGLTPVAEGKERSDP